MLNKIIRYLTKKRISVQKPPLVAPNSGNAGAENAPSEDSTSDGQLSDSVKYEIPGLRHERTDCSVRSDAEVASAVDHHVSRVVTGSERSRVYMSPLPLLGKDRGVPLRYLPPRTLYKVDFEGEDDPHLPYNWPLRRKVLVVVTYLLSDVLVSFMSSIYGPTVPMVEEEFHLGTTPASLGISLLVLGFAVGPVVWGPLSEVYGRVKPFIASQIGFCASCFAAASAKDVQSLMLSRFFCGCFGAGTITTMPSVISDLFTTAYRGNVMSLYSLASVTGPFLSPVAGGFITYSFLGWRWTQYIIGIFASAAFLFFVVCTKETHRPVLLIAKAQEMRYRTNVWAIYAEQEGVSFNFREVCEDNIMRPLRMLLTEPVLLILSLWVGYVYGIQYGSLQMYPLIFEGYGFKKGTIYLPFLGLFLGTVLAACANTFFFEPRFVRLMKKHQKIKLPEARIPPMILGAICFPIGIFWVCWPGAYPKQVHWIVPCVGSLFISFGIFEIFLESVNYVTDVYTGFAASANASLAFVRAAMAASFPLFVTQMFKNLGIQWAGTLLGCLGILALPFPFFFYRFGESLRRRSSYAFHVKE